MGKERKMNILFIHTDQQRRDMVGCYGNTDVKTPCTDALAADGVTFDNCYTPIPICSPSRASILTGLRPVHHGVMRNPESGGTDGRDFIAEFPYFTGELNRLGYDCHHIGKWHVGTEIGPEDCGFRGVNYPGYGYPAQHTHYKAYLEERGLPPFALEDETFGKFPNGEQGIRLMARQAQPVEASIPYYITESALAAIRTSAGSGKSFFLRLDFWGPHWPYYIPEPYYSMYKDLDIPPWPSFAETFEGKPSLQTDYLDYFSLQDLTWEDWLPLVRGCYGYTTLIEDQISRVVALLKELGLYENTATFFTCDHGGMVGSHRLIDKGPFLYDDILRIPFIARVPGLTEAGARNQNWIYNYDLMPTFIDLAGGDIPGGLDARSLLPVLRGEESREPVAFGEFHGHQVITSQRVMRTEKWKYIFNGPQHDELYDLEADPHELKNLANDAAHTRPLREMRERMLAHIKEMKDLLERYFVMNRMKA